MPRRSAGVVRPWYAFSSMRAMSHAIRRPMTDSTTTKIKVLSSDSRAETRRTSNKTVEFTAELYLIIVIVYTFPIYVRTC